MRVACIIVSSIPITDLHVRRTVLCVVDVSIRPGHGVMGNGAPEVVHRFTPAMQAVIELMTTATSQRYMADLVVYHIASSLPMHSSLVNEASL